MAHPLSPESSQKDAAGRPAPAAAEFDVAAAKTHHRARIERRAARLVELAERAERDAQRIVAMLIDRYRPLRVYRWGSLTKPDEFREWSDIDIAVEGLADPLDGLRAADDASAMTDIPVDLVELDRIDPRHAETICTEGTLIHERR